MLVRSPRATKNSAFAQPLISPACTNHHVNFRLRPNGINFVPPSTMPTSVKSGPSPLRSDRLSVLTTRKPGSLLVTSLEFVGRGGTAFISTESEAVPLITVGNAPKLGKPAQLSVATAIVCSP